MGWLRTKIPFATPPKYSLRHFRFRTDDSQGLNVDAGWQAALDTNITMDVEKVFRLRVEVEEQNDVARGAPGQQFAMQWRVNGGAWQQLLNFGYPAATATPGVSAADSAQFAHGDATTNLLAGSGSAFQAGIGVETGITNTLSGFQNEHTEFEFAIRMRRHYDGGRLNAGDEIEFRLTEDNPSKDFQGTSSLLPKVTVSIPVGLIGGTLVETPGRVGPFKDGNGNLYYIHERAETNNVMLISKSTDGGDTWVDVDTVNRPTKTDLEGLDAVLANDRLYILHMQTVAVYLHVFKVSTAASGPDTWETKDEEIETNNNPDPVPSRQMAGISRRSDGDLVAFFIFNNGTNTQIYYRIKPSAGSWGSRIQLDSEAVNFLGLGVCLGNSDKTHIVYNDDAGNVWHRSLDSSDVLSARESLTAAGLIGSSVDNDVVAPVAWDEAGTEKVLVGYAKSDGKIYSRIITNDGAPGTESAAITATTVQRNKGASHAVCFTLAVDGSNVSIMYGDLSTEDIFYDENLDEAGWGTDVEERDAVACHNITGQIYTHSSGNGGQKVMGYVWEDGTDGYTGGLKYNERVFATPLTIAIEGLGKLAAVGCAIAATFAPVAIESVASSARTAEPNAGYTLNVESVKGTARTAEPSLLLTAALESVASSARTGEGAANFAPLVIEGVSPPRPQTGQPSASLSLNILLESIASSARTGEAAVTFAPLAIESVRDTARTGEPNAGYTLNAESVRDRATTREPSLLLAAALESVASGARTGEPAATFAPLAIESVKDGSHTGEPVVTAEALTIALESVASSARTGEPSATFAPVALEGVASGARTGEPGLHQAVSLESVRGTAATGEPSASYEPVAIESVRDRARTGEPAVASGLNVALESVADRATTREPSITQAPVAIESVRSAAATGEPNAGYTLNLESVKSTARTGECQALHGAVALESVKDRAATGEPTISLPQTVALESVRDSAHTGATQIIQGLNVAISSPRAGGRTGSVRVDVLPPEERTARVYNDPRGVIVLREDRTSKVPRDRTGTVVP